MRVPAGYRAPSAAGLARQHRARGGVIDSVPTIMHVKMTDLLQNTSSEINVTQIKYDVEVPDALFDPTRLPKLVDDSVWPKVGATP